MQSIFEKVYAGILKDKISEISGVRVMDKDLKAINNMNLIHRRKRKHCTTLSVRFNYGH